MALTGLLGPYPGDGQVGQALIIGGLLVAFVVLVAGMWLCDRRKRRDARFYCPHCRKDICAARHTVVATRRCFHCAERVLAEPEAAGA
jgi:hypothetical protein